MNTENERPSPVMRKRFRYLKVLRSKSCCLTTRVHVSVKFFHHSNCHIEVHISTAYFFKMHLAFSFSGGKFNSSPFLDNCIKTIVFMAYYTVCKVFDFHDKLIKTNRETALSYFNHKACLSNFKYSFCLNI